MIYPDGHRVVSLAFSADGRTVAGAGDICIRGRLGGAEVKLWNPLSGQLVREIMIDTSTTAYMRSVVFLPGGKTILTALELSPLGSEIAEWDVQNGARRQTWISLKERLCSVTVSPDGNSLALGFQAEIRLFDIRKRRLGPPQRDRRMTGMISSLCYSPDGRLIAGLYDGPVPLMDIKHAGPSMEEIKEFMENWRTVHLWDDQGTYVGRMPLLQSADVSAVAFSPDGQHLAIGSRAHVVRVYRIRQAGS